MNMKIPTGFNLCPLVGSLEQPQLLSRYITVEYFIKMLQNKDLWFTRIYNWRLMDPCEAELLPVFKKKIKSDHKKSEEDYYFHKALIDFNLKSNFGCCFRLYDEEEGENEHMWQRFTPPPQCGVLIIVQAKALYDALINVSDLYQNRYLKKVKYIHDAKAESMLPTDCVHSNKKQFSYEESYFLKRTAYLNEKEARAVLSSRNDSFPKLLHEFIRQESIPYYSIGTSMPANCSVSIKMKDSMLIRTPKDREVFFTKEQSKKFQVMLDNHYEDKNIVNGISIPFNIHLIKKIILHPNIKEGDQTCREIKSEIEKNHLICEVEVSNLYSTSW